MRSISNDSFYWYSYDVGQQICDHIGEEWDSTIIDFARNELKLIPIVPRSTTSREKSRNKIINTAVVDGVKIKRDLNWLYQLYRNDFLALAQKATGLKLVCAANDLYGINLNVQSGRSMRYECHVDSNPVQGMFYVTTHTEDTGGLLYVANRTNAKNVEEVNNDPCVIQPLKGRLVFFDARKHSHYVSALLSEEGIRVAAAMNFYSSTSPESHRPVDLTKHLGLE